MYTRSDGHAQIHEHPGDRGVVGRVAGARRSQVIDHAGRDLRRWRRDREDLLSQWRVQVEQIAGFPRTFGGVHLVAWIIDQDATFADHIDRVYAAFDLSTFREPRRAIHTSPAAQDTRKKIKASRRAMQTVGVDARLDKVCLYERVVERNHLILQREKTDFIILELRGPGRV